ncbi:MAG: L,D-transpeptidase family protein [Candidatus Brocadiia bacterium]
MKKFLLLVALIVIAWLVYSYVLVPGRDKQKPPPPPIPGPVDNNPPSNPPTDGVMLFSQGKYKEAIKRLEQEINDGKAEDQGKYWYYIAVSHDKLEQSEKALKVWEKIVKEYSSAEYCGDAYYEIGRRSKDKAQKIQYLETAQAKFPQSQGGRAAGVELGEYYLSDTSIQDREFKARHAFSMALRSNLPKEKADDIKNKLIEINKKLVFSPYPTPDSTMYAVVPGDTIAAISKKYKVVAPGDLSLGHIRRVNGVKGTNIFPNDNLKILTGVFHIEINKVNHTLTLYMNNEYIKEYMIGVGSPEKSETPPGEFHIAGKVVHPPWTKRFEDGHQEQIPYGDPRNVLGTRWMGFKERPRLGIHGTTKPESIGQNVSDGCIRMHNAEVEELYDLVPEGTKIIIE